MDFQARSNLSLLLGGSLLALVPIPIASAMYWQDWPTFLMYFATPLGTIAAAIGLVRLAKGLTFGKRIALGVVAAGAAVAIGSSVPGVNPHDAALFVVFWMLGMIMTSLGILMTAIVVRLRHSYSATLPRE